MIQHSIHRVRHPRPASGVLMMLLGAAMFQAPAAHARTPVLLRSGVDVYLASAVSGNFTSLMNASEPDLATAILEGNLERVQALIEQDQKMLDTRDPSGNTPLHLAAEAGHIEICKWLIDAGANIEAGNNRGDRPMHHACQRIGSRLALFEILLDAGADVDGMNNGQGTPLIRLTHTRDSDYESVVFLVEHGADVNVDNGLLLRNCAMSGKNKMVEYLLAAGAELPIGDAERSQLLYRAAMGGTRSIFLELFAAGCRPQSSAGEIQLLQFAATGGSPEIGAAVLDLGVSADLLNSFSVAPIHLAAENGHAEFIELLLDRGASIDVRNGLGQTAYNIAQGKNWPEVQALLQERGGVTTAQVFPKLEGDYFGQELPEEQTLHFAPGIISIPGRRSNLTSSPMFSPDGSDMLCTYEFYGPILHSWRVDGVWTPPEPVPFLSEEGESAPVFSADGKRVFFWSKRPIGGDAGARRLWSVLRTLEGWSEPRPVLGEINDFRSSWQFCLDAEDSIYLSIELEEGAGARDIYRVRCVDGEYGLPESLGSGVNSEFNDNMPSISGDGQTLVFIRRGHPGSLGLSDVFVSRLNAQGEWGEAVSAGPNVNRRHAESCPVLSHDGKYLSWLAGSGAYWVSTSVLPGRE